MMDPNLLAFIKSDTPPLNPDTANGLAVVHMREAEHYIDSVLRAVLKDVPGFKYVGCERVSPLEEFAELTRPRARGTGKQQRRQYNMARSDTYMLRYHFEFEGKPFSKLLSLPFISEAGTMFIRGTKYAISPAIVDQVISITPPNVFVRLLRDKLNFTRGPYWYVANSGPHRLEMRETVSVVRSIIYKHKASQKPKMRAKMFNVDTCLVFYLLCKYGAAGMFRTFTNTEVIFVRAEDYETLQQYENDDWVICRSMAAKPKTLGKADYLPTNVRLIIAKSNYNETTKALIAGFYYVLDHFSEEVTIDQVNDTAKWRVCMGMTLWGHEVNAGKLHDDLTDHIDSLDNYIDEIMKLKFKQIGLEINNVYELFFIIIDRFNTWQLAYVNNESNLYGKELSVLYYVLEEMVKHIVLFYFKLVKDSKTGLTESDVANNLMRNLHTQEILNLYKGNGCVSVVNSSGDNKIFRITQVLVPQSKTKITRSSGNVNLNDPSMRLDVSLAEVCSYLGMTKASADGWTRLNLHMAVGPTGGLIRSADLQPMLDEVQRTLIEGRLLASQNSND